MNPYFRIHSKISKVSPRTNTNYSVSKDTNMLNKYNNHILFAMIDNGLAYINNMSVHKKCRPIRSSRLAGQREHIYECLVLLYRFMWEGLGLFIQITESNFNADH